MPTATPPAAPEFLRAGFARRPSADLARRAKVNLATRLRFLPRYIEPGAWRAGATMPVTAQELMEVAYEVDEAEN